MQRIWLQAARPQISCHSISCASSVTGVVTRRAATASPRRRLKLVDAFTFLLTPLFATAAVADANWKDKRRKEWEQKIAEVEDEVEKIRRREHQIWNSLKRGPQKIGKTYIQTRAYSSSVPVPALGDNGEDGIELEESSELGESPEVGGSYVEAPDTHASLGEDDIEKERRIRASERIERLVALKLSIKMLLHIQLGVSPRFKDPNFDFNHDADDLPHDVEGLIQKLQVVRGSLNHLNSYARRPEIHASQKLPRIGQARIDSAIRQLADAFRWDSISLPNFIHRVAQRIIELEDSPSVRGYLPLLHAFSRARLSELAYLVVHAIDESRLALDNYTLYVIFWHYGKERDVLHFDKLLNSLTKVDGSDKTGGRWEWKTIDGTRLPCPPCYDERLFQIVIYVALRCNQPHRAEAWAKLMSRTPRDMDHTSRVLRNFLKYYATYKDWRRGKAWLARALDWVVPLASFDIRLLQRMVYAMLELSIACDQREIYAEIMQAAVETRLGVYLPPPNLRIAEARNVAIMAEWERMHHTVPRCVADDVSPEDKARAFCAKVARLKEIEREDSTPEFCWPHPDHRLKGEERKWRALYKHQKAELQTLKTELHQLKNGPLRTVRDDAPPKPKLNPPSEDAYIKLRPTTSQVPRPRPLNRHTAVK